MDDLDNGVAVYGSDGMVHIGDWDKKWGYKHFDAKGKLVEHYAADEDDTRITRARSSMPYASAGIRARYRDRPHFHDPRPPREYRGAHRAGAEVRPEGAGDRRRPGGRGHQRREYRKHWSTPKGA